MWRLGSAEKTSVRQLQSSSNSSRVPRWLAVVSCRRAGDDVADRSRSREEPREGPMEEPEGPSEEPREMPSRRMTAPRGGGGSPKGACGLGNPRISEKAAE